MLPMPRERTFPKDLSILLAQARQAGPAQLLYFQQDCCVHLVPSLWLSTTVTMNALSASTCKARSGIFQNILRTQRFKDIAANQTGESSIPVWGAKLPYHIPNSRFSLCFLRLSQFEWRSVWNGSNILVRNFPFCQAAFS